MGRKQPALLTRSHLTLTLPELLRVKDAERGAGECVCVRVCVCV